MRRGGTFASPDLAPTSPSRTAMDRASIRAGDSRRKSVEESAEYMTHFERTANCCTRPGRRIERPNEAPSLANEVEALMRETSAPPRIVLVSPTRNEEKTLLETVAAVEAQTLRPVLWILVDDGSTDRTPELLREVALRLPWVRVVTRPDRGFRKVGGGVIEAFDAGRAAIDVEHDFLAKLDVDLSFGPRYLERIMERFAADPRLAAASGKVFRREGGRLV